MTIGCHKLVLKYSAFHPFGRSTRAPHFLSTNAKKFLPPSASCPDAIKTISMFPQEFALWPEPEECRLISLIENKALPVLHSVPSFPSKAGGGAALYKKCEIYRQTAPSSVAQTTTDDLSIYLPFFAGGKLEMCSIS